MPPVDVWVVIVKAPLGLNEGGFFTLLTMTTKLDLEVEASNITVRTCPASEHDKPVSAKSVQLYED